MLPLVLLLAACASPAGAEVDECDASWRGVDAHIVRPGGTEADAVPIECMRQVDDRRVRIGFRMPAGPDCHRLSAIDVVEGADSVAITLRVSRDDDPLAGACPDGPAMATTEIDLQAPVEDRVLLDGSREAGAGRRLEPRLPFST